MSEPFALQRADGAVRATFRFADGATRLAHLHQSDPGRALLPRPEPGQAPSLVFITTSGGLAGGDRLDLALEAGGGARVQAVAQAAEKIYRARPEDEDTRLDQHLRAEAGAVAEWLPQECILFDGARLRRRLVIDMAPDASVLAGDMVVFGRLARGESFERGLLADRWELRRAGRLVWTDRQTLSGDIPALLGQPAGFCGARAQAMILYAAPGAAALLDEMRALLEEPPQGLLAGVTALDGFLLCRLLSRDAAQLRRLFGQLWARLRGQLGFEPTMPRLWQR